jgi:hypothetical protein
MKAPVVLVMAAVVVIWPVQSDKTLSASAVAVAPSGPVHSDFNGDGFADLAVAVHLQDVGAAWSAGAVHVLYGSAGGLQATSPEDQVWTQDAPGVKDTAESNDRFGSSLAAGDFNGDGHADLAAGVPNEDVGAASAVGGVNVLYGSAAGLQAESPDDQFWTQQSPGVKDSAEDGDGQDSSLAAGDFNGDGFADLVVGLPWEDIDRAGEAGAVNILYGSEQGIQAHSPDDQFWSQKSPGVKDSIEEGDLFGSTLAAADFNHDGFGDLALGASREDMVDVQDAGAASVLYGSAAGLQATFPEDQFWTQFSPSVKDSAEEDEQFGYSLAAADFNGDGFADLTVGVLGEDVGVFSDAGGVTVLYGSPLGLQATSPDDQHWVQESPSVKNSADHYDWFGSSLAAGDFNADGLGDAALGVPDERQRGLGNVGAVSILYGSPAGLQARSPDDQFWGQVSPDVEDAAEANDDFGRGLARGDFNGDGFADLAAGVPHEEVDGVDEAGAVNVLYGSSSGLQATEPDDQFWHQDSLELEGTVEESDQFGASLAAG